MEGLIPSSLTYFLAISDLEQCEHPENTAFGYLVDEADLQSLRPEDLVKWCT